MTSGRAENRYRDELSLGWGIDGDESSRGCLCAPDHSASFEMESGVRDGEWGQIAFSHFPTELPVSAVCDPGTPAQTCDSR